MSEYKYQDNLESKRLKTRFLNLEDIETWKKFFEDEEAVEFLPAFGLKTSIQRSEHWINRQLNRYSDNLFGLQLLLNKNTNEVVGQCGLLIQTVDGETKVEVGYHIFKKYWGQGYAPEAAKLFIDHAFENNLSNDIISIIHIDNFKSQKVALKNGLVKTKQTAWNDLEVFIYSIEKNERHGS